PIAIRIPGFFDTVNPLWPPYLLRDTKRIADYERIPYGWPRPDPIVQDASTRKVAAEQPYIHRLTRLGVAASERGRGLPFVAEISRVSGGGGGEGGHDGPRPADAAEGAGLDLDERDTAIAANPGRHGAVIAQNQQAREAAGPGGVPTMVFAAEPFFGQD